MSRRVNWKRTVCLVWNVMNNREKTFGSRNSFSKTDPDTTFVWMKDDYMHKGQLKPGYNAQLATKRRYMIHASTHQRPTLQT